ncbi:hypothetical protein NX059_002973 [Plenodomus lindquistii]|nr:hypothetical protein NX059_002973 [Plenodomus lindquistii]
MASETRKYPCNTCSVTFATSELQRSHMRQSWHIFNLRSRVAALPAVSKEEYDAKAQSPEITCDSKNRGEVKITLSSPMIRSEVHSTSNEMEEEEEELAVVPSTRCLFCSNIFSSLSTNMDHMAITHGLFIPSPERLYDLASFVGYLATIIFEYKECLYCGVEKGTVDGVQTHMRDKGHCMLNLQNGSELLDFWETDEFNDEEGEEDGEKITQRTAAVKISKTEMILPSGTVINSRSYTTQLRTKPGLTHTRSRGLQHRRDKSAECLAIVARTGQGNQADQPCAKDSSRYDHRIAVRGEMGLVGVSEGQRRALQVIEMKMKKREAIAKTKRRHAMEQQPVKAMYYKTENPVYQAG